MSKLKIRELVNLIDRTPENEADVDLNDFAISVGLEDTVWSGQEEFRKAIKGYWLTSWMCTDRMIGKIVYFKDDELIAISHKRYRNQRHVIQFFKEETALAIKSFIQNLQDDFDERAPILLASLDDEIPIRYTVDFWDELRFTKGPYLYKDQMCLLVGEIADDVWKARIKVIDTNSTIVVEVKEIQIPIHTILRETMINRAAAGLGEPA